MAITSSKIALGSVQWGLPYGISNYSGQTSSSEVARILDYARSIGIDVIDTARVYGDSEDVLGQNDLSPFRLITKVRPINACQSCDSYPSEFIINSFEESLRALNLNSVYGLLVHRCEDIFTEYSREIISQLKILKDSAKVDKIGLSVYSPEQVKRALDIFLPDIIQLPVSLVDQRMIADNTLKTLNSLGVEIHARSAFLQGFLLMDPLKVPLYFRPWIDKLYLLQEVCLDLGVSPAHFALNYVISNEYVDYVVVGVESLSQTRDVSSCNLPGDIHIDSDLFAVYDNALINPSLWPK